MLAPETSKNPRKSPSQLRSRATYLAILEATAHILEAEGLDAANTNRIADRAGVSIGSLYQYFPGKTAIFAELIRTQDAQTAERLTALVASTRDQGSLETHLRRLIGAAIEQQFDRPRLGRILDAIEPTLGDDARLLEADEAILNQVSLLLEAHTTEISGPVTKTLVRDVLAIAKGLIDGASLAGETNVDDLEDRVTRALLGYLGQGSDAQESPPS